jgi:GNAT superfamily N-acetyltransferase
VTIDRSIFLIAIDNDELIGCGGFRPITEKVCEIKRMFAKYPGKGIGSKILRHLEIYAKRYDYNEIWLETRIVNENAIKFYLCHGYQIQNNYGKYIGRDEAICFKKTLLQLLDFQKLQTILSHFDGFLVFL